MDWHISQYIHKTMPALKQSECFFVIYNIMSQIINDAVIPKVMTSDIQRYLMVTCSRLTFQFLH